MSMLPDSVMLQSRKGFSVVLHRVVNGGPFEVRLQISQQCDMQRVEQVGVEFGRVVDFGL